MVLGVSFSGDFLQLPPVEAHSLAESMDELGRWSSREQPSEAAATAPGVHSICGEATQGATLWRSVRNVVTLSVPLRAPDVHSLLLSEMRAGSISDVMWDL